MSFDLSRDQATAWFDTLYVGAGGDARSIPWADGAPSPLVVEMLERRPGSGRAVVVGCGLGDDAEAVARSGYDTVAFDVSPAAVDWCRERFPDSDVDYRVADLLQLPGDIVEAFDLVVEVRTVQSLPLGLRDEAIDAVVSLLASGGCAFVVALRRPSEASPTGPPWPLSDHEMKRYEAVGLSISRDDSNKAYFIREYLKP